MKDYKIVTSSSPEGLTEKVRELMKDGWVPIGSHQVVEQHHQNRFRGDQLVDTLIKSDYSQTMIKND